MPDLYSLILYCSLFVSLFFEVFLLITYLEAREEIEKEVGFEGEALNFPSVTVIVPCFNEEHTVEKTIGSLFALDYPNDKLSFVLVDDGSTDGTLDTLRKFEDNSRIRILSKANGGKHTAINLALEKIDSELVGCLDADSFVMSDALQRIVRHFGDESVMAVTPSIKVHEPSNFLELMQSIEYRWGIFLRRMLSSLGALYITPGPFSIFRTRVFKELGGYREAHLTEDLEMALRLQKNRYKIVNSHNAQVYTVAPKNLGALVKQRVRWTYGFINNALDYRELFFNKRYGQVGIFILPIALFSIFSSLFIISNVLLNFFDKIFDVIARYKVAGFNWEFSFPSFDWYFVNTGILPLLTISTVSLTFIILYLSIALSDGKFKFSRGILYYVALYAFFVPLWLSRALFDTVFRRRVSWR